MNISRQPVTLADFRASRKECADLGAAMNADHFEDAPRAGFIYDGDAYIEKERDGTYFLTLNNSQWASADLAELEALLYAWAITECPDALGVSDVAHAFICELQNNMAPEDFAQVITRNAAEPNPNVCHSHDFCDANMCAAEVFEDLNAVWAAARPFLRG